jgi:hypothetical protein
MVFIFFNELIFTYELLGLRKCSNALLLHNIFPLRGNLHKDSNCDAATFLCPLFYLFLTFPKLLDLNLGLSMALNSFISNMPLP